MEENIWRRKIFGPRKRRRNEKENIWRGKIFGSRKKRTRRRKRRKMFGEGKFLV